MSDYKWKPFTLLVSADEVEKGVGVKLEAGKYYKDSKGNKKGPMVWEPKGWFYVDKQLGCWDKSGAADDSRTESDQGNLISEWSESPIREVTRSELVAGVYGIVKVGEVTTHKVIGKVCPIAIGAQPNTPLTYSASELREAAHTLNQIAEYLESEGK